MKTHRITMSMIILGLAAGLIAALCAPAHATAPNTTPASRLSAGPDGTPTAECLVLAQKDDGAKKDKAEGKESKKEKRSRDPKRVALQPLPFPVATDQVILVKDFDIDKADFRGDKSKNEEAVRTQKERLPSELRGVLLGELKGAGFKATDFYSKEAAAKTPDALVIEGAFTLINHGSGATRVMVGLGAGSARIVANVKITKAQNPAAALTEFEIKGSTDKSTWMGGIFTGGNQISGCIIQLARNIAKRFEVTAQGK